jgi:hypothetical protein
MARYGGGVTWPLSCEIASGSCRRMTAFATADGVVPSVLGPVDLLRPLLPASARSLHFAGVWLGRARQPLDPRSSPASVKGRAFVVTY